MKFNSTQSGYSLVEVLVAVMVLMLAIVGPLTIASTGLKNASRAKEQTTAFFLAQEGIEAIVKLREDNALKVYSGSGSDVWDDVEQLDGGVSNSECTLEVPCSVDMENDGVVFSCSSKTCDIYFNESDTAKYNHETTGTLTQYRREIILNVDDTRIHVRSIVTWGEEEGKLVELSEYVYNIYDQ